MAKKTTKLYTVRLRVDSRKGKNRMNEIEGKLKQALGIFAIDFRIIAEGYECSVEEWSGGWSEH